MRTLQSVPDATPLELHIDLVAAWRSSCYHVPIIFRIGVGASGPTSSALTWPNSASPKVHLFPRRSSQAGSRGHRASAVQPFIACMGLSRPKQSPSPSPPPRRPPRSSPTRLAVRPPSQLHPRHPPATPQTPSFAVERGNTKHAAPRSRPQGCWLRLGAAQYALP